MLRLERFAPNMLSHSFFWNPGELKTSSDCTIRRMLPPCEIIYPISNLISHWRNRFIDLFCRRWEDIDFSSPYPSSSFFFCFVYYGNKLYLITFISPLNQLFEFYNKKKNVFSDSCTIVNLLFFSPKIIHSPLSKSFIIFPFKLLFFACYFYNLMSLQSSSCKKIFFFSFLLLKDWR